MSSHARWREGDRITPSSDWGAGKRTDLDQAEWGCAVNSQHGIPLFWGDLVDHAVPGETCPTNLAL